MNTTKQQINEIKNLMERSSRFLSLSGLSGIAAGLTALAGAIFAYVHLNYNVRYFNIDRYFSEAMYNRFSESIVILIINFVVVFVVAVFLAAFFTIRKTKNSGQKIWNATSKRLIVHLAVPLIAGGIFGLILLYHKVIFLIAPVTLIFYGLALLNAGKYTLREIQWLGICEIILGLMATYWIGYGIVFWALGFGILHIVYGIAMYIKYDRN